MVERFIPGKYYYFKAPEEIKEEPYENMWFNEYMEAWFDGKPRKCISTEDYYGAVFEDICSKNQHWDYSRAMEYFFKKEMIIQEEEFEV